ncbi:MAG: hypothetical protein ABW091_02800 [Microbacterium sp.]
MVDARLPAEWVGSIRIDDLSDRAFRILAGARMWRNGQGTGGAILARNTRYLHPDGNDQTAFDELVAPASEPASPHPSQPVHLPKSGRSRETSRILRRMM